jgi:GH24 family phage-related lysozyme (muramidase)
MSRVVIIGRKGILPFVLAGATVAGGLERWEGNIKEVYADKLAYNVPTMCAGMTDWKAVVGTKLTDDQCRVINKATLVKYGTAIAYCTEWKHLTQYRFDALTLFAVNVGVSAACGSSAVKAINRGDIKGGCDLIALKPNGTPNWSYAGGKYVRGLYNRRLFERDWCLRGLS